jgi:hypothetical protein
LSFLRAESVSAARLTGIGALESVTLGYFDWNTTQCEQHRVNGQVELLSLAGDVTCTRARLGCMRTSSWVAATPASSDPRGRATDARADTSRTCLRAYASATDAQSCLALIAPEL